MGKAGRGPGGARGFRRNTAKGWVYGLILALNSASCVALGKSQPRRPEAHLKHEKVSRRFVASKAQLWGSVLSLACEDLGDIPEKGF